MEKRVVYKVEKGENTEDILATTYQMRNFYRQFADGFFSTLDVMNYIQHQVIANKARGVLVDVCCGRGLMLPLLRYQKKITKYIGVDISEKNIDEARKGCVRNGVYGKPVDDELDSYYPFEVEWINSLVSRMTEHIEENSVDFIVYTSAIEHMHKDEGGTSLEQCYKIMKPGATMYISCPNTEGDGYDVQYKGAHIYEWKYDELKQKLLALGFSIEKEIGILLDAKTMEALYMDNPLYRQLHDYLPAMWLEPILAVPYPKEAREMMFICRKSKTGSFGF